MKYLAAVLVSLTYVAGYLHGIHYNGHAYVLGGICVFGLGLLFARAEKGAAFEVVESANAEALTLDDIDPEAAWFYHPLYIASHAPGIHRVTSAFVARIDGQQGLILETS